MSNRPDIIRRLTVVFRDHDYTLADLGEAVTITANRIGYMPAGKAERYSDWLAALDHYRPLLGEDFCKQVERAIEGRKPLATIMRETAQFVACEIEGSGLTIQRKRKGEAAEGVMLGKDDPKYADWHTSLKDSPDDEFNLLCRTLMRQHR